MVNKPKRTGTAWESILRGYFQQWWPNAERRVLAGAGGDKGDFINLPFVCEAKAVRKFALSQWMQELHDEKRNAHQEIGFVVIKRTNHNVSKAYCVMELKDMIDIMLRLEGRNDLPED